MLYAFFEGHPSEGNHLCGTGFTSGDIDLKHSVDNDSVYYISIGFEKSDQSDFTETDFKNLAKSFSISYNG